MRNVLLLIGAAAMSLAGPVVAQDQGKGNAGGRAEASQAGKGKKAPGAADRGGPPAERGNRGAVAKSESKGPEKQERRAERSDAAARKFERKPERVAGRPEDRLPNARRGDERGHDTVRSVRRDERGRLERDDWPDERFAREHDFWRDRLPVRAAVRPDGCPPGLARQNAFCMPPGQLKKAEMMGRRLPFADAAYNIPDRYRYRFTDDERFIYRYDDEGTIYRLLRNSGVVDGVIPLLGTGLLLGQPMPLGYEIYNVPVQYRSWYQDTDDDYYRYDDSAIYRIDPETSLVEGIVALLTGGVGGLGGLGIGDALPAGYDVYNVPLDYRDTYYDTDDAMYRYADGNIYQVDPQTRLIQEIIGLLV